MSEARGRTETARGTQAPRGTVAAEFAVHDISGRRSALIARLRGEAGRPLIADGSTGTALGNLRPATVPRLALLPLEEPALVESLHRAYFEAGSELVETATFQASARGVRRIASGGVKIGGVLISDPSELAYRLNLAAARAARRAAEAAEKASGGSLRFVAGSIGPGDSPPSLGKSSWTELRDSYLPQARGLAEGGCDLAIVETCQDPLQIKAALAALISSEGGRGLPFIVSATVDCRGRMLAGTSLAAFVDIIAPFRPLALGLNCSGGPAELALPLAELASLSPFPLSFMPNAGLPKQTGSSTIWPLDAEAFAEGTVTLARKHGVALVGGCCGTGPATIAALVRHLGSGYSIRDRPWRLPALASLYESKPIGTSLFQIGERANAAGSAAFSALVKAGELEGAAELALRQEGAGAEALDLHLSRPGRDEMADLAALVRILNGSAHAALSLDSRNPEVFAAALPRIGGKPLLNSTSLESEEKARRVFSLAKEFGAAVVCLALDSSGPARKAEDKASLCRGLYQLAVEEMDMPPSDLFFDPLVFTAVGGPSGSAAETLAALPLIKQACPGSLTILGVGNVSHGLPRSVRPLLTAVFLEEARKAGLDAAILDAGRLPEVEALPAETRAAALALLRGEAGEGGDPLELLRAAVTVPGCVVPEFMAPDFVDTGAVVPGTAIDAKLAPAAALRLALLGGDRLAAIDRAMVSAEAKGVQATIEAVSGAIAEAGGLWSAGELPLPLVLRSVEAARAVLDRLPTAGAGRGTVVMATVRGDLHDIGKNIAAAILSCSGYRVIDLGTDVPTGRIVAALAETGAAALGLSGLLTQSLAEMREVCAALEAEGSTALVLLGGAAVDADYVASFIEPCHPGRVAACSDAFAGLARLEDLGLSTSSLARVGTAQPETLITGSTRRQGKDSGLAPAKAELPESASRSPIEPPFFGVRLLTELEPESLFAKLDRASLFHARWGYRRAWDAEDGRGSLGSRGSTMAGTHKGPPSGGFAEAGKELALLEDLILSSALLAPKASLGFFRCRRAGLDLLVEEADSEHTLRRFPFTRQSGENAASIADYYRSEGDFFAAFAVTIGPGIADSARAFREEGRLAEYWRLHGLGSALAEAAAEIVHARLGELLAERGLPRGKRYSFGFRHCPGLGSQVDILALLRGQDLGIRVTEGFQLDPEHSITAFVVAREDAEYF